MEIKRILTIAGSDSGGGAGIQADLKTITILDGYGMSVITALTAQNTIGVQAIQEIPASFVAKQIDSVLSDIGADAIKTGMLYNREIIEVVAKKIEQYGIEIVVVDPVMVSKSGVYLLRKDAQKALTKRLIPLSTIITPNLFEASVITGMEVRSLEGMRKAAVRLWEMGAKNVLIKGGHLRGRAIDILYSGEDFSEFSSPKIKEKHTHGTGCTLASAIATLLARGESITEAVRKAKQFIYLAIRAGLEIGKGNGPTNPSAYVLKELERYPVLQELKKAIKKLREERIGHLIPEVSSNLGYALPYAEGVGDVAAFPGRIIRVGETIATLGDPEFGASQHIARIILTVMKWNPRYLSAMNIRYSKENVERLNEKGFSGGYFDRRLEPKGIKGIEGSSLEWGVEEVLKKGSKIPDFIYDEGEVGKEPMIRIIGRDPMDVVEKILKTFK
ncbi:MAG: bifunctional hydroxymethylpyrimidine kinase/phosphomethylpyrimidine kinase [Thermodesulfobacteriota bacterium]